MKKRALIEESEIGDKSIESIEAARKRMKEGHFLTAEEAKKRLGF